MLHNRTTPPFTPLVRQIENGACNAELRLGFDNVVKTTLTPERQIEGLSRNSCGILTSSP